MEENKIYQQADRIVEMGKRLKEQADQITALQSSLKEKEKECEELKELIYSIRPKAEAYDRVCNNVGVENNLISKFEELKAENERLKGKELPPHLEKIWQDFLTENNL